MDIEITKLAIIGSSGFAREILDLGHALGVREFKFLDVDNYNKTCVGFDVIEDTELNVQQLINENWRFAVGIGEPKLREKIVSNHSQCSFPNLVHPSATFGYNTIQSIKPDSRKLFQIIPNAAFQI